MIRWSTALDYVLAVFSRTFWLWTMAASWECSRGARKIFLAERLRRSPSLPDADVLERSRHCLARLTDHLVDLALLGSKSAAYCVPGLSPWPTAPAATGASCLRQRIERVDYDGAQGRVAIRFHDEAAGVLPRPRTQEIGS